MWEREAAMSPVEVEERGEERWRHEFDTSVSAVSMGFVATAILVSMFLLMAIFERFLRGHNASGGYQTHRRSADPEAQRWGTAGKINDPCSPDQMSVYSKGVSVLMPGHDIPTFIAHPAPAPCPPERISWPSHQQNHFTGSTSDS
ncbi:uncharacterized protein [Typha angustifolia]|uniref:uncharacterized protein n=1 Tax=Typha angustifolia TaxID=59011 RepID=UPI003C2B7424